MSISLRRYVALASLVVASTSPLVAAPSANAASATSKSVVVNILTGTDGYLTKVRTFFLCTTAKCKKERSTLLKSAQSSMTNLSAQAATASKASVQKEYRATLKLFVTDVHLLASSYHVYFTTTSTVTLSGDVGNIFYLTSEIGSDVNVLRAAEKNAAVTFNLWVEGEAATLVAMQTDASALQSSTATTAIGIYANQLLQQECASMIVHADGPNAAFNAQLVKFAHNQARISQSEILFLQGKKAPLTETQVASLNVTVAAEFAQLIKSETALVKKKK